MDTAMVISVLTLRYRQEGNRSNCVFVGTADSVVDVPQRHVERVELILTSCDRYSGLVCPCENRDKHGTMRGGVLSNGRLMIEYI